MTTTMQNERFNISYYLNRLLAIRSAVGAAIALILLTLFLSGVDEPDPLWPKYWMLRPYVILPLAGAAGATCFHILDRFFLGKGWKRVLANISGVIIYIIGLWMGTVLGFVGTLWH